MGGSTKNLFINIKVALGLYYVVKNYSHNFSSIPFTFPRCLASLYLLFSYIGLHFFLFHVFPRRFIVCWTSMASHGLRDNQEGASSDASSGDHPGDRHGPSSFPVVQ